jgi:hypothetical protein
MGEIVLTNKQKRKLDGEVVTAEERAEFLLKNDYPVPTDDYDELVELIQKRMDEEEKREQEELKEKGLLPASNGISSRR